MFFAYNYFALLHTVYNLINFAKSVPVLAYVDQAMRLSTAVIAVFEHFLAGRHIGGDLIGQKIQHFVGVVTFQSYATYR
uniref:Uncharacterized protein n=1 Tax=Romanomermis culicivorax TaxID=13658 RepID=A0A915J132_ROMCU